MATVPPGPNQPTGPTGPPVPPMRTLTTRYALAGDCTIAWTSANWDRFANENGAPELAGDSVVGQSLWRFVAGAETRAVYEALFDRVLGSGEPVTVPFRCDSPDLRRFMELRIRRGAGKGLELRAELVREEPRPRVAVLGSAQPRAGAPVVLCSFCKRVRVEDPTGPSSRGSTEWLELEEAASRLDPLAATPPPPVRHGVCPDCEERLLQSPRLGGPDLGADP